MEQYVDNIRVETRVENKERLSKLSFNWKSDEEGRVEFLTSKDSQAFSGIKRGPCNCRLTIPLFCPPETELTFRFFLEKIHGLRTLVGEQTFVFKDILDKSIEREKNREQQAGESTDKGSGNAAMENPNEQKKDRTGQNGDNSTEQTAVNDSLESFSDEESRKETQQAGEIGAKDAGSTDAIIRADAEEEGERSCSNTEKQIDDRFCELRTKLDKAFYKIEQVHDKIETDFRPKFEDTFNEIFKDAFEQGLVSTLPEEIERHLSRYVTQDSLSERLKAFDHLQIKLEEQKKRLDDQKKEIDSIQTEVVNKRVKEVLEQFRDYFFKATIEPLQNKIDGLSNILEEKVSRKILEKTHERIDSSLEAIKADLIWLSKEILKIDDVRKSFSLFEEEIRRLVRGPSMDIVKPMDLVKERKLEHIKAVILGDPISALHLSTPFLVKWRKLFSEFEHSFYDSLSEVCPREILADSNSKELESFREIARPVLEKMNDLQGKMSLKDGNFIHEVFENREFMGFETFTDHFIHSEEAITAFEANNPPDLETEYRGYLDRALGELWNDYREWRARRIGSLYRDETQLLSDLEDLVDFIFSDFLQDGFARIARWQEQFPEEKRQSREEKKAVREKVIACCWLKEIEVKPESDYFDHHIHFRQNQTRNPRYPDKMVTRVFSKGYRIDLTGTIIKKAGVQFNCR